MKRTRRSRLSAASSKRKRRVGKKTKNVNKWKKKLGHHHVSPWAGRYKEGRIPLFLVSERVEPLCKEEHCTKDENPAHWVNINLSDVVRQRLERAVEFLSRHVNVAQTITAQDERRAVHALLNGILAADREAN